MKAEQNPERYKKLSVPFESQEQAETALENFFRAVGELREQYQLPDVMVTVRLKCLVDGKARLMGTGHHWGSSTNSLSMAYGQFQKAFEHQQMLLALMHSIYEPEQLEELAQVTEG